MLSNCHELLKPIIYPFMEYFKSIEKLLAVQKKHFDFFHNEQSIITDYIEICDGRLEYMKIKKSLPQCILDDIVTEFNNSI